jgi:hypothetical protein
MKLSGKERTPAEIDWPTHNGADVALFLCGVLDGVGLQLGSPSECESSAGGATPGNETRCGGLVSASLLSATELGAQVSGSQKGDLFEGYNGFPTKGDRMRPSGTRMLELWLRLRSGGGWMPGRELLGVGEPCCFCWDHTEAGITNLYSVQCGDLPCSVPSVALRLARSLSAGLHGTDQDPENAMPRLRHRMQN